MYNKFVEDYLKLPKKYLFLTFYYLGEPQIFGDRGFPFYDPYCYRKYLLMDIRRGIIQHQFWDYYFMENFNMTGFPAPVYGFLDAFRILKYSVLPTDSTINDFWVGTYFKNLFRIFQTNELSVKRLLFESWMDLECTEIYTWYELYGYAYYFYGGLNKPYLVSKPWIYQEDIFYQTLIDYIPTFFFPLPNPIRWVYRLWKRPVPTLARAFRAETFYGRQFFMYDRPLERPHLAYNVQGQSFYSKVTNKPLYYKYFLSLYDSSKDNNVLFKRVKPNYDSVQFNKFGAYADKLLFHNLRNLEYTMFNYLPFHFRSDAYYVRYESKYIKRMLFLSRLLRYLRSNENYRFNRSYEKADSLYQIGVLAALALHLLPSYMIMIFSIMVVPRTRKDALWARSRRKKKKKVFKAYFIHLKTYFTEKESMSLKNIKVYFRWRFKKLFLYTLLFSLPVLVFFLL